MAVGEEPLYAGVAGSDHDGDDVGEAGEGSEGGDDGAEFGVTLEGEVAGSTGCGQGRSKEYAA